MQSPRRLGFSDQARLSLTLALCFVLGCATPEPPKPPSLNLPEPTRDLTATRIGNTVELHFTVPSRSTDKQPLRGTNLTASFCRALGAQPCQLASSSTILVPLAPEAATGGRHNSFTWTDTLPSDFTHGDPRPMHYSVELFNASGRSAGMSTPAFTAAGQVPAPVIGLRAEGSRLGVLLRWNASDHFPGDIVVQREELAPALTETVQLTTPPRYSGAAPTSLLDTSAKPDIPYRYIAVRRLIVELAHHSVELRSTLSEAVDLTLRTVYAPLAPTGLNAAAFTSTEGSHAFAIDLVWQPVDEAGLIAALAGYNVYRASGDASTQPIRLNASPVTLPAFHDTTAVAGVKYRYSVTSVDVKGNESSAAGVLVGP